MLSRGIAYVNQKSIKAATVEQNVFDVALKPEFDGDPRVIEKTFGQLETFYPLIIQNVLGRQALQREHRSMLVALLCSLLVRSVRLRGRVEELLEGPERTRFVDELTRQMSAPQGPLFKNFILGAEHRKNVLNYALLAMMDNLYWTFVGYNIVFVHTAHPDGWWTSDDPVLHHHDLNAEKFFSEETELYFPLSPDVLLYMHHKNSKVKEGAFRTFEDGSHVDAEVEQFEAITQMIVSNGDDFVFFNREYHFNGPIEGFPIRLVP